MVTSVLSISRFAGVSVAPVPSKAGSWRMENTAEVAGGVSPLSADFWRVPETSAQCPMLADVGAPAAR